MKTESYVTNVMMDLDQMVMVDVNKTPTKPSVMLDVLTEVVELLESNTLIMFVIIVYLLIT
jgi:hypothetical protein